MTGKGGHGEGRGTQREVTIRKGDSSKCSKENVTAAVVSSVTSFPAGGR